MKYSISILLFAFLLLSPKSIRGQDNDPSKIRLGLSASFEKNTSSESIPFSDVTGFTADYDQFNYRVGLDLEYFFNNNLTINTAVNYANKDLTGEYYCFVCDFILPFTTEPSDFRFIEVPITIKYYFLPGKARLFGEAGLNNLIALNDLDFDGRTNSYALGLKAGVGVEYSLSPELALQFKVDYNSSISKVLKDSDFELQSINIGFGIMKRL